jgi:hypothetical protein
VIKAVELPGTKSLWITYRSSEILTRLNLAGFAELLTVCVGHPHGASEQQSDRETKG